MEAAKIVHFAGLVEVAKIAHFAGLVEVAIVHLALEDALLVHSLHIS